MDSQSTSDRLVTSKLASNQNIIRNQNLLAVRSTCIGLICSLIFLPVCHFASVDVKGQLHKDVLLPCTVIYKDAFDYNLLVVHWQQSANDVVVYTFFYGSSQPDHQADHYRGRTEMFYDLLPSGNLSLLLKNVSESDAGTYTCHSILKESSGFIIRHVNLIVEERSEDQIQTHNPLLIRITICAISLGLILSIGLLYFQKKLWNRNGKSDEERAPLVDNENSQGFVIQNYRKYMASMLQPEDYPFLQRQLIVKKCSFLESSGTMKTCIGNDSEAISAEELFTPEKQQLISRRMVLVGDAGAGKSWLCKWIQNKWAQEDIKMYACIVYVSCKKINNKTSLKEMCDNIYKDLSSVLTMDNILLIFDGLDNLVHENNNLSPTQESDTNSLLHVHTLLEKIMITELVPDTDVLIVCRNGSMTDLQKGCNSAFILLDFTEEETKNICNTITANDQKSYKRCQRISDITYMPAFVVMMSHFSTDVNMEINGESSPYRILTEVLLKWTTNYIGKSGERKNIFTKMAKHSYENLTKGEPNSADSMEYWDTFLLLYNCQIQNKYQCNMLRDMLAAAYCVWETHRTGFLIECLDVWVFGNNANLCSNTNVLLRSIADEHNAKYYLFIRFFMRLMNYPDCESLCNNTPMKNKNTQESLAGWFKESFSRHSQHSEKIKLIHCIFELHDEKVARKALSTIKKLELLNTPLNFKDIQALEYCFRDIALEELDLRLCDLGDKCVGQLRSMIKNTKNVLLSSNHLTKETGKLLGEILEEPDCIIEKLSLGTNQLGDHGAQDLWKALTFNKTLTGLYVYHNNITDEGIHGMVEYLQKNHSLKELHLCGNTFGDDGLTKIQELKDTKKELEVVLWIAENLELFQYVENRISGLNQTWKSYDQKWLVNLLALVLKDLEKRDCNKDPQITWERVDNLIQNIKKVLKQEKFEIAEM